MRYARFFTHFVKRTLKAPHYARYVDDLVFVGLTLEQAKDYRSIMEEFLKIKLNLDLSKAAIAPIKAGLNFVGYRTWRSRRFVRRHSLYKFSKSLRDQNVPSLNSLMAHAKHTSTHSFYCRKIATLVPDLIPFLPHFSTYQELK